MYSHLHLEIQGKFLTNCTYLQDEEFTIGKFKCYASPWCPNMYQWLCDKFVNLLKQPEKLLNLKNFDNQYFFRDDEGMKQAWNNVPQDVDILVTHTPPLGILDLNEFGSYRGCPALLERLSFFHKLKIHLFGHIHSVNGCKFLTMNEVHSICNQFNRTPLGEPHSEEILFVNAANSNQYQPFYFDL